MSSEIALHLWLPEPHLSFHPDRKSDREIHPLRGLCRFGPHSSGLVPDPIRVATLAPAGEGRRLYEFMRELNSTYKPTERRDYLPDWPGFRGAFSLQMRAAGGSCHIELDAQLETDFRASPVPHIVLADRLVRAIHQLEARRMEFDVLFIYIPQRWAPGYIGGLADDFDLHDHVKAATAARRRLSNWYVRTRLWPIPTEPASCGALGSPSTSRPAGYHGSWPRLIQRQRISGFRMRFARPHLIDLDLSPAVAKCSMPRARV
jgi:hypothetical protein